jgi:hypothetical protein
VEVFDSASTRDSSTAKPQLSSLVTTFHGPNRIHSFQNTSIVVCVFVAAGTCLPSRCLVTNVSCGFTIQAFRRHVTIRRETKIATMKISLSAREFSSEKLPSLGTMSSQRCFGRSIKLSAGYISLVLKLQRVD